MGQKTHPIGFRVGIYRDWESRWFDLQNMPQLLEEDAKIRGYVKNRYKNAAISRIGIDRTPNKVTVRILTARPGIVIGKKGANKEALRQELEKLTGKSVDVTIEEIDNPYTDAQVVADNIATQMEKRISHKRAMKRAVESAMKSNEVQGIKVLCAGRLGGAEIARSEWYRQGRVPLQTLRANIDYGVSTAFTTAGTVGVKVWIFKGETLSKGLLDPIAGSKKKRRR